VLELGDHVSRSNLPFVMFFKRHNHRFVLPCLFCSELVIQHLDELQG